jgi:hypothetical protein
MILDNEAGMKAIANWIRIVWTKTQSFWSFIFIAALLGGAWIVFLSLIDKPPLETTPALIMIWASLGVLILAAFPKILNRIKKLKVGDIEVELLDAISKSNFQNYITVADEGGRSIIAEKGDPRDLQTIMARIMHQKNTPVLLTVNLENEISRAFLLVYILLIDLFSESVILFVSKRNHIIRSLSDIRVQEIVGVISGRKLINEYFGRFPSLLRLFNSNNNYPVENVYVSKALVNVPSTEIIQRLYELCTINIDRDLVEEEREGRNHKSYYGSLRKDEVENWLFTKLSKKSIERLLEKDDIENLIQSLVDHDEFLLIVDNKRLSSVTRVEEMTNIISKKLLSQIQKDK